MTRQPSPKPGKQDVTPLVVADLQARSDAGLKTYGRRLQTHNGRDAGIDLYEELLDAVCYAKQERLERRALLVELRDASKGCGKDMFASPSLCGEVVDVRDRLNLCGRCAARREAAISRLISEVEDEK